jgi:signal recognition particle receptor subunit beta
MFGVIVLALRIDENIIDKDQDKFIKLRHEHGVHEVHEVGRSISESEGHNQELIKTITSGKCGFRNVARSNLDLVVARTKVDLREDFGTSQLIKQNINSGKRVFVFDGDCIEWWIIYAHLMLPSFFLTKRAGQPQGEELGRI